MIGHRPTRDGVRGYGVKVTHETGEIRWIGILRTVTNWYSRALTSQEEARLIAKEMRVVPGTQKATVVKVTRVRWVPNG